jgi:hypothetical protein
LPGNRATQFLELQGNSHTVAYCLGQVLFAISELIDEPVDESAYLFEL